jgi:transposase-like protein
MGVKKAILWENNPKQEVSLMFFNKPFPEGLYCPNAQCALFGRQVGARLERHSYYGCDRRVMYLCRECGQTFSENRGTFFFDLRTPREKVLTALTMVAEGGGIRATGRAVGVDKDTIQRWVERAGKHAEEVSAYLMTERHLSQAQVDALWTFIKKKTGNSRRRTIRKKSEIFSYGVA